MSVRSIVGIDCEGARARQVQKAHVPKGEGRRRGGPTGFKTVYLLEGSHPIVSLGILLFIHFSFSRKKLVQSRPRAGTGTG